MINRLERYIGWMAIERLPLYVVTTQALLYIWILINPEGKDLITLDPIAIRVMGEWWRVFTFLFIVPFQNPLFTFLYLYFQYVCGMALEEEWGAFPFTLFYFLGALGSIAASFLVGHHLGSFYLNETIFLAFAALYPNFQILFFFILPLKVKWLAIFVWVHILFGLFLAPLIYKLAILLSLLHYVIFFGRKHVMDVTAAIRRYRHRQKYKDQL